MKQKADSTIKAKKKNEKEKEEKKIKKIILSIEEKETFLQAFTHTSYLNDAKDKKQKSYEKLEFLGDSIIDLYTAYFIYLNFPDYSEGQMSKLKQLMIKESTLSSLSESCDLGKYIRLGKGEEKNNGSKKKSILSDVFESFVASLYLEKGGKKVWEFLNLTIFSWVKGKENLIWDHKSQLQEYCQSKKFSLNYETDLKSIINNQQFFL